MANTAPTTKVIPSFDPFDVKTQLVDLAENYFNLDNIDLYESGFMGYLIQALTTITSDTLYQNAFAYNEAFLNRALLKSSVTNIANQLGYDIKSAVPAIGALTVAVPITLGSNTSIKISAGSAVSAGSISYKVYNTYYIKQDSSGVHITAYNTDTGLIETVPYTIELHEGSTCVVFGVIIWQVSIYTYDFTFDNPTLYQFYTESISGYTGEVYKVIISVDSEKYSQVNSLYLSQNDSRNYELNFVNGTSDDDSKINIKFGNGVYGYQPKNSAKGTITLYTTLGSKGNIVANSAELDVRLIDTLNADAGNIEVISTNALAINNGEDAETLEEIKLHAKQNISAAKRLVTETDFKGYAGVTGLRNIVAYPLLDRRNMNGNQITIYNALFDDNNNLIPTASIPLEMSATVNKISKGQEFTLADGITYTSPFELVYDNTYDIPYVKYIYNLSTTSVAPILFSDNTPDDVEMSLKSLQTKFYPNDNYMVFMTEIYKMDSMNSANIGAKLYIGDRQPIDLKFAQEYNDKTIMNMASNYINYDSFPTGLLDWKVELYYTYPSTTTPILYNTYEGTFTLFSQGQFVGSAIEKTLTPASPESFLNVSKCNFSMAAATASNAVFTIPILKMSNTNILGEEFSFNDISAECDFNGSSYQMSLFSVNSDQTNYTYTTPYFDVTNLEVGPYELTFKVYSKLNGERVLYNTYTTSITILEDGKRIVENIVTKEPETIGVPNIELVHLGLSVIDIRASDDGTSYNFVCDVTKLHNNASSNISVILTLNASSYDLNAGNQYFMEYGGDMTLATSEDEIAQSTVVVFKSPAILSEYISTGIVSFKIELRYKGVSVASYKQNVTFKQDISRIMTSDIHKFSDNKTYACSVPVIRKDFYDTNLDYLDNTILSQFLNLSDNFNQYAMLTDSINMKFVRTCGTSTNMLLNSYMAAPIKVYDDNFYIDIPVKIHAKIYVSKDVASDIATISTEAQNIIYTFLSLKSGFNVNIYRSEISRYLHDALPDILFCEIDEPTDEIIYDFDISKIPSNQSEIFYRYCPEYIWFNKDNITVDVMLM